MKVLVIGGGGREHAIVWKLAQSKRVSELYCAPGNGGIAELATCLPLDVMDIEAAVALAKEKAIDFVVVAPDDPLAAGMVDALEEAGIRAFGPNKAAAYLEASKAYSKDLMKKYNLPTADYEIFTDAEAAKDYLKSAKLPIVLKADGLALGKGVLICQNLEEALAGVTSIMEDKQFGTAGNTLVIEEFMTGPEVSVLAFTDGKTVIPMVSSQDHKRALDNDEGLNTGGMGTFSPSRLYTDDLAKTCMDRIFQPTVDAMRAEGRPFKGVLFFGLMLTEEGPKVLEYNARFGDPETQVVLPRLQNDLLDVFEAVVDEKLDSVELSWSEQAAVCVVMASGGYPVSYEKGYPIDGLDGLKAEDDILVFHAGTKNEDGLCKTNGGRVLGVTALADGLDGAIERSYEAVRKISFKDAHYRTDIGRK